jgi:SARP family transcriptional regulator, regulator of embCAB operon
VEISLLGPLEASFGDVRLNVPGEKLRTLLAIFGLSPSTAVSQDQLIGELWPQAPPKDTVNSLQVHVLRLRQLLASYAGARAARELLVTTSTGYRLCVPSDTIDAIRFTQLATAAQQPGLEPAQRQRLLTQALDMWRGPALLDVGDSMTCRIAALRLEEARLIAQEELFDAELGLRRHAAAVPLLEQFSARYPLRERFSEQLMIALYRSGRQDDAIDVYHRTRQRLLSERGLEPNESIRSRFQEILRQVVR